MRGSPKRASSDARQIRHRRHRPHQVRAPARARHGLDECRGLPQRARRRRHREVRRRCAVREGADLEVFLDVRPDAGRGDAPAAEGRRRVGSGRRHQHQHDLVRLHGDRRRPVRRRNRVPRRRSEDRHAPGLREGLGRRRRLWLVLGRRRLWPDDAAAYGGIRHQARAIRRDRGRGAQSRRQQSARGAARAAHARQIHGVAVHH